MNKNDLETIAQRVAAILRGEDPAPAEEDPAPAEEEPTFSPDDLAKVWGITGQTVRMMCRRGELAHTRLGKRYAIRMADAEQIAPIKPLIGVEEAAKILGLHVSSVHARARSGALGCYRFGSARRFDPTVVEESVRETLLETIRERLEAKVSVKDLRTLLSILDDLGKS